MTTDTDSPSERSLRPTPILAVTAALLGLSTFGYALLLVPSSLLGGGWIAAIGVSLLLSALFATEWAGARFDLSANGQQRLSVAFAVLAVFLLVTFVLVNGATFEPGSAEGSL